ncbi:MAG: MFS transporter [Bacillota bacterium]|nr:MFS transporter [Bacillota bacterium]
MSMKQEKRNILYLQSFYLLTFFGIGSLFPLLSVFLSGVEKLNGYQIGTILSVGPIVTIFLQPFWGLISDATNSPTKVLTITTFLAGIFGFGYLAFGTYSMFFITAILIAIFQSAIIPVSDSISLKYSSRINFNYGNIRLFGSLGFGTAVFIMGRLSEISPQIIFYSFFASLSVAAILAFLLPKEKPTNQTKLLTGMKDLFKVRKFLVFLIITFLIFGPNLANNVYFGLFVDNLGGTYTGIGIAFLIAVLSEIPFMRVAGKAIQRFGLLQVAALAGAVSMVRWFFYAMEPSLALVYASAVIQGISIGLFIPAGLQYIRDITPSHITATAVTIYSAIGNGLGNWFSTYIGGIILDKYSIFGVYLFFGILASIGVLLTFWLIKMEKNSLVISHLSVQDHS